MRSLWLIGILNVFALETGILIGFTPDSINDILKDFLPVLSSEIQSMLIPSISIPSIGKGSVTVDLKLSSIKTPQFKIDASTSGIVFTEDRKILFSLHQLSMESVMDWEISKAKFVQSGKSTISVSKADLLAEFLVSETTDRKITVQSVKFEISDFHVKLSDNPGAGAVNWVLDAINNKVKDVLAKEVSSMTKTLFQGVFTNLEKIDRLPIGNSLHLSIAYSNPPVINTRYLYFNLEGTFKINGLNYEFDIPKPVSLSFETAESMQLSVSTYSVNSAFYSLYLAKLLKFDTQSLGANMTCKFLDAVFPGISQQYGKSTIANLKFVASESPSSKISNNIMTTSLSLNCDLFIEGHNESVLKLALDLDVFNTVKFENWAVTGEITSVVVNEVKAAENKQLDANVNENGIKDLINLTFKLIRKNLNKMIFGNGFVIPLKTQAFIQGMDIELKEEYILFELTPRFPN